MLSSQQVQNFHLQGYTVIEGLLSPNPLSRMTERAAHIITEWDEASQQAAFICRK